MQCFFDDPFSVEFVYDLIGNQSKPTSSRPAQRTISFALSVLLVWGATAYGLPFDQSSEINTLMGILYERSQFNGAILVARRGTILYRKAYGKVNFQTGSNFTPETPSNIDSVTKQFTAMSIMVLEERKKLTYDDPVSKYIPEFSRSASFSKITMRHLLTHTSGMPDYGDLGSTIPVLTNADSLQPSSKKKAVLWPRV